MIFSYGFSIRGKSHMSTDAPCQDSHRILEMKNGWYVAAVADGVGSAKNSQVGSKIAVDTVVDFCNEYMPDDNNVINIKSMIRTAFNYALKKIADESKRTGNPIDTYDTTLSLVIYNGNRVIFGHAGDGAIIGLNVFGDFVELTYPIKGDDGFTVIPLRGGYTQWLIDSYEEDLAAVMLLTDGMLETICPYLLKDTERNINRAYLPLASFFADPNGIPKNKQERKKVRGYIRDFLEAKEDYNSERFYKRLLDIYRTRIPKAADHMVSDIKERNYPVMMMQNEQDDKSVVCLMNTSLKVDNKEPDYYADSDWERLQERWNRKAYPHMYSDNYVDEDTDLIKLGDYSSYTGEDTLFVKIIKFLAKVLIIVLILVGFILAKNFIENGPDLGDSNEIASQLWEDMN